MRSREEIISEALGQYGAVALGISVLEALHRNGYFVQKTPTDPQPLIMSLRERGQNADADAVEALAGELDRMRRGWGPSTPTERQQRQADIITMRHFIEDAYGELIELNLDNYSADDVAEANHGAINAVRHLLTGLRWAAERLAACQPIQDREQMKLALGEP